jgi:hypothetical protein
MSSFASVALMESKNKPSSLSPSVSKSSSIFMLLPFKAISSAIDATPLHNKALALSVISDTHGKLFFYHLILLQVRNLVEISTVVVDDFIQARLIKEPNLLQLFN